MRRKRETKTLLLLHIPLLRIISLPLHHATEGQVNDEEFQKQLEDERYRFAVEALSRCLQKGAERKDIDVLAHECGVNPKHIEAR